MSESEWVNARTCERSVFRNMLGSFMTGVTVVAARDADGQSQAFTANSFTSVSLDPPLVLVCLAKSAASFDVFTRAEQFSINILGEWQREVSIAFASRSSAKLQAMNALTPGVPPLVEGSLANLLCERVNLVDAGDHAILIGGVTSFKAATGQPLGYFRGGYVGFGLAVRSLELMATPLLVGGLLEHDGRVVLCRRPGAPKWEVPSLPLRPGQQHSTLIRDVFARLEIRANTSFLYSVFQEEGNAHTTMIFSVEADGPFSCGRLPDGTETASFESGDEPWNLVEGSMTQGMLTRFFREKSAGCFGIYCDTSDGGRVAVITDKPQHWTEWNPGLHQS